MTIDLTDPAFELASMAGWIIALPSHNRPLAEHLSEKLGLDHRSTDYVLLLSDVRLRLDRMRAFVRTMCDKEFVENSRDSLDHACARITGFFYRSTKRKVLTKLGHQLF